MTEPNNENENANVHEAEVVNADAQPANDNQAIVTSHQVAETQFDLKSLPPEQQLEVVRDILASEAEIEAMALPQVNSSNILNRRINILDAAFKTITDKKTKTDKVCVSFVCEFAEGDAQAGEQFTCLKSSNPFNNAYVTRFDRMRGIVSRPLMNYEFVEDARYKVGDNISHVLRRISPAIAAASSK